MKREEMERDFGSNTSIDENNKWERRYWAEKWGVTEKQLSEAFEQCDNCTVEEIRNYLVTHKYLT